MSSPSGIITLLTDFGEGVYVAAMKGAILSVAPRAAIVDMDHSIAPQGVLQASFILAAASATYPLRTVHCAVVDPGVGTSRRIILVEAVGRYLLAPDNGVLTRVLDSAQASRAVIRAWNVTNTRFFRHPVSATFHGRDIFAPVAAALAAGERPYAFGDEIDPASIARLSIPKARRTRSGIRGQIIFVDRFGNLVTNIKSSDVARATSGGRGMGAGMVCCGNRIICGVSETYGAAPQAAWIAMIGSFGLLEVAIVGGSAADAGGFGAGTPVTLLKPGSRR